MKEPNIQNFFDSYGGMIIGVNNLTNNQTLRVSTKKSTSRLSSMFSGVSKVYINLISELQVNTKTRTI